MGILEETPARELSDRQLRRELYRAMSVELERAITLLEGRRAPRHPADRTSEVMAECRRREWNR